MSDLRALSVARPWTKLILTGQKTIENRTWPTFYRGPLLVHAATSWDGRAEGFARDLGVAVCGYRLGYPTGILGVVDLVKVCTMASRSIRYPETSECDCGPWAVDGQHHWHLANPRLLAEPVPHRGRLGLWEPTADALAAVAAQGVLDVG